MAAVDESHNAMRQETEQLWLHPPTCAYPERGVCGSTMTTEAAVPTDEESIMTAVNYWLKTKRAPPNVDSLPVHIRRHFKSIEKRVRPMPPRSAERSHNRFHSDKLSDEWTPMDASLVKQAFELLRDKPESFVAKAPRPVPGDNISVKVMTRLLADAVAAHQAAGEQKKVRNAIVISELLARVVALTNELAEAEAEDVDDGGESIKLTRAFHHRQVDKTGWSAGKGSGAAFTSDAFHRMLPLALQQLPTRHPNVFA